MFSAKVLRSLAAASAVAVMFSVVHVAPAHADDGQPDPGLGGDPAACDRTVMMGTSNPPSCVINNRPDDVKVTVTPKLVHEGETFTIAVEAKKPDARMPSTFGWDLEYFYPWGKDFGQPGWYPQNAPPLRQPRGFPDDRPFGNSVKASSCQPTDTECSWRLVKAPLYLLNPGTPMPPSYTV